ncbi:DUF3307 domain-containing protein [Corticicoccus populi]|uniref:DUF3307 domain-containing protein n=1 Tax=Corticicoccus populi TaxID=1812821 RepID=A0ABW5WUE0_9STAP
MVLLLLILAHLTADFLMQSNQMVKEKLKYLNPHIFHHFLVAGVSLVIIWGYQYHFQNILMHFLLPLAFIIFTHYLIDISKIKISSRYQGRAASDMRPLAVFLLDQGLHLAVILTAGILFFNITAESIRLFFENGFSTSLNFPETIVFIVIVYILATTVSGVIVKHIIGTIPSSLANFEGEMTLQSRKNAEKGKKIAEIENSFTEAHHYFTYSTPIRSRGRYIGYLERLLVIILTVSGAYEAIAFIIAAKAIARFKQLNDRNWAEYFLLGTLSSIFLAVILGILVRQIL